MYICVYVCMHACMCIYVCIYVAGMNMNAVGIRIHPFQWNVYVFGRKITFITQFFVIMWYITNDIIDPFLKL